MSVSLDAESTITEIIQAMLPSGSGEGNAVYIHIDMRGRYYPPGDDKADWPGEMDECRDVHLIFERPNHYVKVWAAVTTTMTRPKANAFTLRSNHDSCWRSDGLRDIYPTDLDIHQALVARGADSAKITCTNTIRIERVKVVYDKDARKYPLIKITDIR